MKFGTVLKDLLKMNNISQQELATKIGVSQRAVSKWINLQSEPTESAIKNCAKYFNVSSDYLLGLEDEAGRKTYDKTFNNHNHIVNNGTINQINQLR